MSKNYEITYFGDKKISNVHHIGVETNGNYYSVIFGEYVNGGFFSIPNWNTGGELADLSDVFWNTENIGRALDNNVIGKVIAEAIVDYVKDQYFN